MTYLNVSKQYVFLILLLSVHAVNAQNFVLPNAYAHNDYRHKRPLLDALDNGFTYLEADIFLRNDKLIVAHILPCLKKNRTLELLYLEPLLAHVEKNDNEKNEKEANSSHLTLMIDVKSDANKTYQALALVLEKYKSILSEYKDGCLTVRNVTIVITGHKPYELINSNSNRLVFMDEDLRNATMDSTISVNPIASCKYSNLVKWKGKGSINANEVSRLKYYVGLAHRNGRKVRLWGSPENKVVWTELLKCNVDLINTDNLKALRKFLISDKLGIAKKG